jgi:hypothetical protein
MKLTKPQLDLLSELPDSPSDGKRCKGWKLVVARNLESRQLTRRVGVGSVGVWFVRTAAGKRELGAADGFNADGSFPRLSETPCPRCLKLARDRRIRVEMVQRLPEGVAAAPLARDGSGKCCLDCASADAVMGRLLTPSAEDGDDRRGQYFEMARIAVGNDRQEQYRVPGAPMGLVAEGVVRPSKPGDLKNQLAWLERMRWFLYEGEQK